jgi:phosphonate transport system substrate-binding protein
MARIGLTQRNQPSHAIPSRLVGVTIPCGGRVMRLSRIRKQRKRAKFMWVLFSLLPVLMVLGSCTNGGRTQADYVPAYSAQRQGRTTAPEYIFGFNPEHGPVTESEMYQPVMDAINRQATGFTVRMESSRDYPTHEAKLQERKYDLALMNPYQALAAEKMGYVIFGEFGGESHHCGLVIVRKDSGIKTVKDLRGKTISFPSPTAIAATLMPKVVLIKAGLNVEKDAKPVYVGSIDSVVMNVYSGLSAAGGIWPGTWEGMQKQRPEIIDALEIKWRSAPVGNVAFVARVDMPAAHVNAIAKALFDLDKTEQGRLILSRLNIPRIEPANSKTFDPVRKFLEEYKRLFGSLPEMAGTKR